MTEVSELKGIPQGRDTREFRQEAVKLVLEEGLSWAKAAQRLSLPASTLANWVKAAKAGKLGDVGKNYRPLTEVEMELARTRKELVEVKMERDILKKRHDRGSQPRHVNGLSSGASVGIMAMTIRPNADEGGPDYASCSGSGTHSGSLGGGYGAMLWIGCPSEDGGCLFAGRRTRQATYGVYSDVCHDDEGAA